MHRESHRARMIDFFSGNAPAREIAQRPVGRELVIFRKTALDCDETDKRVDRVLHHENCSGRRVACQTRWLKRTQLALQERDAARDPDVAMLRFIDKARRSV